MLGPLVVTGVGALAFKLGMDSQVMYSKGKSTADVIASLPGNAINVVSNAIMACYRPIANLFPCTNNNDKTKEGKKNVKEKRS